MKKNMFYLISLFIILFLSSFLFINKAFAHDNIISLYCWDIKSIKLMELNEEIKYLNINTLYIERPRDTFEINKLKQIMKFVRQYNIDVFLLDGDVDWLTTGDINNVKDLINQVYQLNETLDYKLKGVSLDVEFYLTQDYESLSHEEQVELFRTFTKKTKECCDYANRLGLGYSMALPVWFDKLVGTELEDLINYDYDHIAFMNYYKETILDNMNDEVYYAKKHNIKIVSIVELQNPKNGNVREEDTFYNDGLRECFNTLNKIKRKYNYENLGVSYHYYKPLLELLKRDTDIRLEDKYELEVITYLGDTNVKVEEIYINNNDFMPIYTINNNSHVVIFYGLEYGKEYTLVLKSDNMIASKTFKYLKRDDNNKESLMAKIPLILESENEDNKPVNYYCLVKDNEYYDSKGLKVTKESYYKDCTNYLPPNPETGINLGIVIPFSIIILLIIKLRIKKQSKIYKI